MVGLDPPTPEAITPAQCRVECDQALGDMKLTIEVRGAPLPARSDT